MSKLPTGTRGIYLDILPTENMKDFLNELASAIIRNVSDKKGFGHKVWDFIKSLRPSMTFDMLSGNPQVSFTLKEKEVNPHIEMIFAFLEKLDEKFFIAIDEFQQILNYPEANTDAWLRSVIQKMKNITFIFSGSQQHIMKELFTFPSRPFYNSAALLKIDKIERKEYSSFIIKKFNEKGRKADATIIDQIMDWTECHTYYLQLLCNRLYITGATAITEALWKEEALRLLSEQEPVFFNYRGMLTLSQWQLFKAIASEGYLYEPTSKEFIMRYGLGSGATILRSIRALLRMELIYYDFNKDGKKYYMINDLLFRRWAENRD
jgi:hypothetical protein